MVLVVPMLRPWQWGGGHVVLVHAILCHQAVQLVAFGYLLFKMPVGHLSLLVVQAFYSRVLFFQAFFFFQVVQAVF